MCASTDSRRVKVTAHAVTGAVIVTSRIIGAATVTVTGAEIQTETVTTIVQVAVAESEAGAEATKRAVIEVEAEVVGQMQKEGGRKHER